MGVLSWTENYGEGLFMDLKMFLLKIDEAYLKIATDSSKTYHLYGLYEECDKCPFSYEKSIKNDDVLTIDTKYTKYWSVVPDDDGLILTNNSKALCTINESLEEFGVYALNISESSCKLQVLKEPVSIYFPILTVLLIYVLFGLIFSIIFYVWRVHMNRLERPVKPMEKTENQQKKRLKSLDTFRGISIVLMIFVNYGCGGYSVWEHAIWNGLLLSDLVFPWFMWIMGVCIPISVSSILKKDISKKSTLKNIVRRSLILFGLGLFLTSGPYLDTLRIFGVLQRFGICYLVTATSFIIFSKGLKVLNENKQDLNIWRDIIALKMQWAIAILLLLIHSLIIFLLEVPNCERGYLGPGGLHENGKHFLCTGGASGYVDKIILGEHRFQKPTILKIYKSEAFDPEGILGCFTSIFQVFLGAQAGAIILFYKSDKERLLRWIIWGVILGIIGGALCGFSKNEGLIPINKNLWSFSYVLVTSSLAFFLLAACYYLIDVKEVWTGKPFLFAGMNAILMYVGHSMVFTNFPFHWIPYKEFGLSTHFIMLIENIWATGMWVVVAFYLYRIKYFLSI